MRVLNTVNLKLSEPLPLNLLLDVARIEGRGAKDQCVSGITLDSRKATCGSVFLAFPGPLADGRHFIVDAVQRGASAVVAEASSQLPAVSVPVFQVRGLRRFAGAMISRFYADPTHKLHLIGITGTNGKTSVSHFLAQLYAALDTPCALMGTLGLGQYPHLQATLNTTPDPILSHAFCRHMLTQGVRHLAMEVSSHGLHQERVAGLRFDSAIFTNLTRDHLDYHATMSTYAAVKAQFFSLPHLERVLINHDDPWASYMVQASRCRQLLSYSLRNNRADVFFKKLSCHQRGARALFMSPWGQCEMDIPLLGCFNLYNILAAAGELAAQQIALEDIAKAVTCVKPVSGRLQFFGGQQEPLFLVDYAHTPDAVKNVLQTVKVLTKGRVICVLGCGGNRDPGKRPVMLKEALGQADFVVVTCDNPRSEDPALIARDMLRGLPARFKDNIALCLDRALAIRKAYNRAQVGDSICILGKGHETYQEIKGVRHPYSDIEQVEVLLSRE